MANRAQVVHVRQIAAREIELDRIRTRREQQLVVAVRAPACHRHLLAGDVQGEHPLAEHQVDPVLVEELARAQRQPLLRRAACEVVLGQVRAIHRQGGVSADQLQLSAVALAAQRLARNVTGRTGAHDDNPARRASADSPAAQAPAGACPPARARPPASPRSRGSRSALAAVAAPVRRSKHAWCHGQRSVPSLSRPSASGPE